MIMKLGDAKDYINEENIKEKREEINYGMLEQRDEGWNEWISKCDI